MQAITFSTVSILLVNLLLLGSCDKEDTPSTTSTSGSIVIDASDAGKWVYFSFEKDTLVTVSNYKSSMEWDMGFHLFDIRLNGGTAGLGQGASFATGSTRFQEVVLAPEKGYAFIDFVEVAVDLSVIPPVTEVVPGDTLLSSWITMTYGASGPEFHFSDEVFVVRTANGNYAKVWLKDFFNDEAQLGYVTLQYLYQADGSRNLAE